MGFLEINDLASAASFKMRLVPCIVTVAGIVLAEDQSALAVPEATKRTALAAAVMRDPLAQVQSFIWPVLSNNAIATAGLDATDGDLQYQVTQIWDQVAGVTRDDKILPTP